MIHYREYEPTASDLQQFEREQRAAKLITVGTEGWPCVGVYPFLRSGDFLEVHLVRTDEQVDHMKSRAVASLLLDEVLSSVPSDWFGPMATHADQMHCTVQYECEAGIIDDVSEVRRHLDDLLARYQPGTRFAPLDHPEYDAHVRAICVIRLRPMRVRAKFKIGQKLNAEARETLISHLRERDKAADRRSIAAIESFGSRTDYHGSERAQSIDE